MIVAIDTIANKLKQEVLNNNNFKTATLNNVSDCFFVALTSGNNMPNVKFNGEGISVFRETWYKAYAIIKFTKSMTNLNITVTL